MRRPRLEQRLLQPQRSRRDEQSSVSQGTLPNVVSKGKSFFVADANARLGSAGVRSFFVVVSKQDRQQKNGGSFCSLRLSDRTGQCEAVIWDDAKPLVSPFGAGEVVAAEFDISTYSGRTQLVIKRLRRAEQHEYALADFQPHTKLSVDELWTKLNGFVESFTDPFLQQLVRSFLDDPEVAAQLRAAPAAKALHHAWIGGLLEHIVSLLGLCDVVCPHYPHVHRDLVMTGAILHDVGKLEELRWNLNFEYTLEGQMLGHITLGIASIERRIAAIPNFPPELRLMVEHIVLSHHGRYEFGSPKLPMTPEAILFHYLDDLDAKMFSVRTELERSAQQGRGAAEMTEWVRSLERPLLDTQAFLKDADAIKAPAEVTNDALPAEE
jgi:3'-5' exoribonuclease